MASRHHQGQRHSYPRSARVNALLQEVLGERIEALQDERLALITVTAVSCEPDLRRAVVYLATLPQEAKEALDEHRKELQSHLGREVRMKRVPVLSFALDPAIVAGAAVEEALRRIDGSAQKTDEEP